MGLVKALLLDIGGVLLSNGWDRELRKKTAETFKIDYIEMNSRHHLIFDTYETGKITFEEYLTRTIFFEKRDFTIKDVKEFIFKAVYPFEDMIQYIKEIKEKHHLKIGVISNEGRELAVDRIHRFDLPSFVDFFIVSAFAHFRKPDSDIYRLAIDVVQVPPSNIVYIDDRSLLIEVAKGLGLNGIHHTSIETTKAALDLLFSQN